MIRRDLLTGHWIPYLERALKLNPCYDLPINGGEVCPYMTHLALIFTSGYVHDFLLLFYLEIYCLQLARWM
jgi:hypothetical protein